MFPAKRDKTEKKDSGSRKVDWIVLTVSLVGFLIVVAASIQAGEAGLVASLGHYVTATAAF
ncbi:hypothetical protein O4H53_12215 [Sulfitobacter sp. G21635-S1]|uniref:hypothetical protein n=1 Tax=Sulfitobacter sp. G21635-S1 TaxID=3014043 RepID=UPI0022AFAE16|nr:hypothetical protein [Sulfitobacter sp. G21635-S1]MCZ4256306.1 hypothetical protein [Sulfitobacter sp. G21635-S1]